MHKIWFQVTGSHAEGMPEQILHKDNKKFIGGLHSMDDKELDKLHEKSGKGERVKWAALQHTKKETEKLSHYPDYSWYYHNKIRAIDAIREIDNILASDPEAFFIFYSAYPLRNVLTIAQHFKDHLPLQSKIIYYKKAFWIDEVDIGNHYRNLVEEIDSTCEDFSALKSIETSLIALADIVYLADSLNTKGSGELDTKEKRDELTSFRDSFLAANPKVILKSMKNQVYKLIDSIK